MSQEDNGWEEYYRAIKGRPPRQLLLDALTYFANDSTQPEWKAIDLGCGDRTETAVLLEQGWNVLAIEHASYSLPFCSPEHFDAFWAKIVNAIKSGGRLAGQLFGVRDSWANEPDMTFHTEEQVRKMLENFEIEYFREMDEDGSAVSGPKHWHVFTVIARKR